MRKQKYAVRRLLSGMLAAAFLFMLPVPTGAKTLYRRITAPEELTTGQYVLIAAGGFAPRVLDGSWVTAAQPAQSGDEVSDTAGAVWTLRVTDSGVILTDGNGQSITPRDDGVNGITAGEYSWQVSWEDGCASFHGFSGDEAVTLAANESADYGFRAYRDGVITGDPGSYPSRFTLYRETEVFTEPQPTAAPETQPAPEPTAAPTTQLATLPEQEETTLPEPEETTPPKPEETTLPEPEEATVSETQAPTVPKLQKPAKTEPVTQPKSQTSEEHAPAGTVPAESETLPSEPVSPDSAAAPQTASGWNLYFGQLHAHTNLSDGTGSVEEAFTHAADVAGLDFFAVTDHSDSFDNAAQGTIDTDGAAVSAEWAAGKAAAAAVTDETFVGIFGYEMTWQETKRLGHITTFNTPGWQTRDQDGYLSRPTALENYYETLTAIPGSVSQFNHPGTFYGDFEGFGHYDPEYDAMVTLLEVSGEDGVTDCTYYDLALSQGWHVAPTNSQNNHNGSWGDANDGRTVVLAKNLTEAELYNAMKNCRVYATEDRDLEIDYTLNGAVMGSVIPKTDTALICVSLNDPTDAAIGTVEVMTENGKTLASQWVATASDTLELSVPSGHRYYYLRVTQPDGDAAVTAPVWMEGYDDLGIAELVSDTQAPARGEEISLTVELYNREPVDFTVDTLRVYADDTLIHTAEACGTVESMGTLRCSFSYAHPGLGITTLRAVAEGTVSGEKRTWEKTLTLSFRLPELTRHIAVDASHSNAGTEELNRLTEIAAGANIGVTLCRTELPEDSEILLISAPSEPFEEDFLGRVAQIVQRGGTVILCGQADGKNPDLHCAGELNRLLEAMGATMRFRDDTAWDEINNGGTGDVLFTTVFNTESALCRNLKPEQVYSQRGGCTVDAGSGTWLVRGLSTTGSRDCSGSDSGQSPVLLAREEISGGCVYVSGGLFLADGDMEKPRNLWESASANQTILETLLDVEQVSYPLCTIAQLRNGETGEVYHVRGRATSGTSRPGNSFADTLYLQDNTGGVALMPFTQSGIQVGTPMEVLGQKEVRDGNIVLKIIDYEVLTEDFYRYVPQTVSNKEAMDYAANGGRLLQVEGKVTEVSYTVGGKGVSRFTLKDSSGEMAQVLIEDGIYGSDGTNALASQVKKGRTVRAMGILHLDSDGNPVLRVRNCDEVVYVPPIPIPLRAVPRTGDYIWIAAATLVLSLTGLVFLLKKRKW